MPDVGTWRALRRTLIRTLWRPVVAAELPETAFMAPSLPISAVRPNSRLCTFKGWTRMGFSRQQAKHFSAVGALAAGLLFGLTSAAGAQGAVRSVHGDWQIRCDTPPGAQG